jgi:hypothetical protein
MSQNGTRDAASRLMWQRLCAVLFGVVLAGYVLALCGLAISSLRESISEPPNPPVMAQNQSTWITVNYDYSMPTNLSDRHSRVSHAITTNSFNTEAMHWENPDSLHARLTVNSNSPMATNLVTWRCKRRILSQYNTENMHHWKVILRN